MNLETLPDEIFLYNVFLYFSWEELSHTFLGLNQRFIVDATTEHHPALVIFAQDIARLEVCLGQFDLRPFINLRSLYLHYPTPRQRDAIRPENFPLLERLRLAYPLEDPILSIELLLIILGLVLLNFVQYPLVSIIPMEQYVFFVLVRKQFD